MKILHIAVHMGAGIGSAYAGLGSCGEQQKILLLEKPIDQASLAKVEAAGFQSLVCSNRETLVRELHDADIVLFNWTHHPVMTRLLRHFPDVPIRSIFWCHVSGNYFPQIPAALVQEFDHAIFAAPFSLELPQLKALGESYLKEHCSVVYGLNDLRRFAGVERKRQGPYTIGYVGTLGFCKLHPDFVEYCAATGIPGARFLMVGAPSTKHALLETAAKAGLAGQFEFYGQLPDVTPALGRMDVFGYLLNPQHFGATENALLEAMAAGLPVVALDQCVEKGIIQNGKTGLLVHSPQEYGKAVRYLYENPEHAARLGKAAKADVLSRYDPDLNRQRFLAACGRAMQGEKRPHRFNDFFSGEPADWFLSCVGSNIGCFQENRLQDAGWIFREPTKGSPIHYHTCFPKDKRLALWAEKLQSAVPGKKGF